MIKAEEIYEVKVSAKNMKNAKDRAEKFKSNKFTFSKDSDSKIAGLLSEEIFANNFPGVKVADKNYNCDFIIENLGTVDIKTKRCKSKPLVSYECSLSAYQAEKQNSEYLLFCRCSYDFSFVWFLGMISKKRFMKQAVFVPKGTREGKFLCRADMFNLPISKLGNFMEFIYQ